jgi:hypothetical protein
MSATNPAQHPTTQICSLCAGDWAHCSACGATGRLGIPEQVYPEPVEWVIYQFDGATGAISHRPLQVWACTAADALALAEVDTNTRYCIQQVNHKREKEDEG